MTGIRIPSATYRLQFHHGFRFIAAQALVPYLCDLGITDLYASPLFKAKKHSLHGYSVTNPLEINPELGSRVSFTALSRALKSRGMGLMVDIVPNHMALSHDNPWWLEVLENGPASPYAMFFDIDWRPPQRVLEGRVLQPILGAPYGQALESQEIRLTLDEGGFAVRYYDHKFPLDPKTYHLILTHRLDALTQKLGEENPAVVTLRGLVTLIEHLPPRTVASKKRLQERQRQKEVIKKNLWLNYQGNQAIKKFLDKNLEIINGKKGDPESFNLLDRLLSSQPYRLAWWRVSLDLINYRRFFSVNDLISLRVEDPRVFEASHSLIFSLIRDGRISGLRIDHIDGLFDPEGYLRRLQEQICAAPQTPAAGDHRFYVVVEKILAGDESLPPTWPVAGTTGYDFLNQVNGLFVDPEGLQHVQTMYARFTHLKQALPDVVYDKKKLVLTTLFGGEVETMVYHLGLLGEHDRQARDVSRQDLHDALVEVIACLPQYRTYIRDLVVSPQDRKCLEHSFAAARRRRPELNPLALDFISRVLLLNFPPDAPEERKKAWLQFAKRWQQFTGPIMAKGLEDTALYVYTPLASLNEVGGNFQAVSPETFHRLNQHRLECWPHSLLATSTHDTKRSEDVRMRLHVLSEIPDEWTAALNRWSAWNGGLKRQVNGLAAPDANEEYFLYQTLVGAWPLKAEEIPDFKQRLKAYLIKAAREAKVHTRWIAANQAYEDALLGFMEDILSDGPENNFLKDFQEFQSRTAFWGALNSLSQVLLKIASPGVPDFYQGTELWDLSLVDPDNRRPVDFEERANLLKDIKKKAAKDPGALIHTLLRTWKTGALKLFITYKALNFRKAQPDLFLKGDYIPLVAQGTHREHIVAFARRRQNTWAVVVAARFFSRILAPGEVSFDPEVWRDSSLAIPREAPGKWQNIFTGEQLLSHAAEPSPLLPLPRLLGTLPVALLVGRTD